MESWRIFWRNKRSKLACKRIPYQRVLNKDDYYIGKYIKYLRIIELLRNIEVSSICGILNF